MTMFFDTLKGIIPAIYRENKKQNHNAGEKSKKVLKFDQRHSNVLNRERWRTKHPIHPSGDWFWDTL